MKGHTIEGGHKRPTKKGAGMTAKGVAKYKKDNPGSKLKTAVTGKVKMPSVESLIVQEAWDRQNNFLKLQKTLTVA